MQRSLLVIGLTLLLLAGFFLASRSLVCSDTLRKADVVIQCVGQGMEERCREIEARRLVREGLSDYLFIPTLFMLLKAGADGRYPTVIRFTDIRPGIGLPGPRPDNESTREYFRKIRNLGHLPRYYENTHAEIVLTKKAMDACGFRRAIFVSSPWHLGRIRLIAGRVFDASYDIRMAPSRWENDGGSFTAWRSALDIMAEFPKIFWFLCYDLWERSAGSDPAHAQSPAVDRLDDMNRSR